MHGRRRLAGRAIHWFSIEDRSEASKMAGSGRAFTTKNVIGRVTRRWLLGRLGRTMIDWWERKDRGGMKEKQPKQTMEEGRQKTEGLGGKQ